jgi:hypothetical protein
MRRPILYSLKPFLNKLIADMLKNHLPGGVSNNISTSTDPAGDFSDYATEKENATDGVPDSEEMGNIACNMINYTGPTLSIAEKAAFDEAVDEFFENNEEIIQQEVIGLYDAPKDQYADCVPGPGSPCSTGADGPDILEDIKTAGLTATDELLSHNQETYMAESTMQTLWNSWGRGTAPRMVNGKTVSFTRSSGDGEAFLRIGDGECNNDILSNTAKIKDELTNQCLKVVYNEINANNIENKIRKMFNDIFEDPINFNVTFKDDLPASGNLGETQIIDIKKVGENLTSLDVEINLNAYTLSGYSKEYIAFIHEMLHAYYSAKPELFPPSTDEVEEL